MDLPPILTVTRPFLRDIHHRQIQHCLLYTYTLIKRAAEGTEFAALEPQLEGPTALAVSKEDATAPARILAEFAKTAPKLEPVSYTHLDRNRAHRSQPGPWRFI